MAGWCRVEGRVFRVQGGKWHWVAMFSAVGMNSELPVRDPVPAPQLPCSSAPPSSQLPTLYSQPSIPYFPRPI